MKLRNYLPNKIYFNFHYKNFLPHYNGIDSGMDYHLSYNSWGKGKERNEYRCIYDSIYDSIIIFEGKCEDRKDFLEKSIKSFNEKIGNIHDYADTYRKRNLILKDLL